MAKAQTKAVTATRTSTTTSASKQPQPASRDEIAERAYEIWTQRGGDAMENWLAAENDLKGKNTSTNRSRASRS